MDPVVNLSEKKCVSNPTSWLLTRVSERIDKYTDETSWSSSSSVTVDSIIRTDSSRSGLEQYWPFDTISRSHHEQIVMESIFIQTFFRVRDVLLDERASPKYYRTRQVFVSSISCLLYRFKEHVLFRVQVYIFDPLVDFDDTSVTYESSTSTLKTTETDSNMISVIIIIDQSTVTTMSFRNTSL